MVCVDLDTNTVARVIVFERDVALETTYLNDVLRLWDAAAVVKRVGVPAELHIYATAAHDFGVRASDHPYATWTQSCVAWMRQQGFLAPKKRP